MFSIAPPFLQPGQRVALVATARKITVAEVEFAVQTLTGWGWEVRVGESIGAAQHQFAGDDDLRRRDLQRQLDDPRIRAIFSGASSVGCEPEPSVITTTRTSTPSRSYS